jgi:AcrR family transcriptional regulator
MTMPDRPRQGAASSRSGARRRAWGSLSRDEILRVARQLIERDGLQELSLTRLGKELRAGATSIYWYFPSKEELVSAVVEDVTREMHLLIPPIGNGPWDEEFIEHHLAGRRLLQRSRLYRDVFAYQTHRAFEQAQMTPFILDRVEALLAVLIRAGLTPNEAVEAYNAFQDYTRAFVLIEEGRQPEEMDPHAIQLLHLAVVRVVPELSGDGGANQLAQALELNDACYRLGLDLLVEGVRQRYLAPGRPRTNAKKRRSTRAGAHGT